MSFILLPLGAIVMALVFWASIINPRIEAERLKNQEYRILCIESGGTPITNDPNLGDVCIKEFIKIRES